MDFHCYSYHVWYYYMHICITIHFLVGKGGLAVFHQRDYKEYVGLWMDY